MSLPLENASNLRLFCLDTAIAGAERTYDQLVAALDAQYGSASSNGDTGIEGARRDASISNRDAQYYASRDTSWAGTLSGSATIGNTPWTLKATTAANAQAAYSTNRARAQAAHDAALLSAMNDWQTSNRSSTLSLLVAEGQSREAYNKATATVYANWELGIGNLLGDKPAGTGWEIDESHDEKNKRYFGGHHNVGTVGLASGINRGFDEGSDPRVPVPSVGRGTDGRGSMLPPLPDARSVVSQRSFQPTSEENLRLHPNTVAFLRDHPEFAKAFYEREGFTHLQRLNTVLSYGWTVNLADWFWGRDRYYSHTSELEIWIDTDMSIADQTDALVELIDDIYLKKKIPLDSHNVLSAFESPGFLDPSKPRDQAFIQAQYQSAEFGRGVARDIALEAAGLPIVVLSRGDDVYRVLSKLDDVAPKRLGIIAQADEALSPLAKQFPDAKVGFRGSLARGTKGSHKGGGPFDPTDFDVDAFIVSDELAAVIPKDRNGFRNLGRLSDHRTLIESISNKLRSITGHRNEAVKIRVFSTEEFLKLSPDEVHLLP